MKDSKRQENKKKEKSPVIGLRLLDFDDLYLLGHLLDGETIAATARHLGLTQPAITQRVRKMERVFGIPLLQKAGRHVKLTPGGRSICHKASDALALMQTIQGVDVEILQIGAAPYIAESYLHTNIQKLIDHGIRFEVEIGSSQVLIDRLESGSIECALVEGSQRRRTFREIPIGTEELILIAARDLADELETKTSLAETLLFDTDRSNPLIQKIDAEFRAKMELKQSEFLGSESMVMKSVLGGKGVGVVSMSLAKPFLETDKVRQIFADVAIEEASYVLLHKQDSKMLPSLDTLIRILKP